MTNKETEDSLNYFVYDKDYPLHSHAEIVCAGSAGSGKSYFVYNRILPVYVKAGKYRTILIASRTGKFDKTTATALNNPIYNDCAIKFIKMDETFKMCQQIRAVAIVNDFLKRCTEINKYKEFEKIYKELDDMVSDNSDFEFIKPSLIELRKTFNKFKNLEVDEIKFWAKQALNQQPNQLTNNPVIVVFDDCSGSDEFMKPYSAVHKLSYVRRHLRLTMIINVQSITSISTNIRRNTTVFVCFSTLSEKDLKLLSDRLPIRWTYKDLYDAFLKIADETERDNKVITITTVFPNLSVILGTPECLRKI